MFDEGKEQALDWLCRASLVKYVDGAWLAHLVRVTTGSSTSDGMSLQDQRRAARASWQVMSEELGDGDLARSHVAIYENLMDRVAKDRGIAHQPPKGEDRQFTEWIPAGGDQDGNLDVDSIGNDRCWRAAIVQLCLSISPNEFLPEALGFNAAYESLPYHLAVSAREIEELLDKNHSLYFTLHLTIDNADSGHSAMARIAVEDYIKAAHRFGGPAYANEMWARVKLGYALADGVPTTPTLHRSDEDGTPSHLTSTVVTNQDMDGHDENQLKQRRADQLEKKTSRGCDTKSQIADCLWAPCFSSRTNCR